MHKTVIFFALFSCFFIRSIAQADSVDDNILDTLGSTASKGKDPVTATFKATRIIDGCSVENLGAGVLDFRISHRFGQLNQGGQNFFGLDDATTSIGLDYGITKWLMIGLAHSALNKEDNGFVKIKLLRQKTDGTPITVSYAGELSVQTTPNPVLPAGDTWAFGNKLYYTNQLLIARKFSKSFSLQLTPTIVHYNIVDSSKFSNNTIAIGVGGRIKVSKRIAITAEYYYRITNSDLLVNGQKTYNALSVGIDIETGGHVFQLMLTNAQGLTDRTFIGQTTDSWGNGAIHFGFNISRVFTVVKPKEFRD